MSADRTRPNQTSGGPSLHVIGPVVVAATMTPPTMG